jgi:hypothetical protein
MIDDPNSLEVLVAFATEVEAMSIVAALGEREIEASATGGAAFGGTFGMDGQVEVLVKRADLDRAKQALAELREELKGIDWSAVDVEEPGESDTGPA